MQIGGYSFTFIFFGYNYGFGGHVLQPGLQVVGKTPQQVRIIRPGHTHQLLGILAGTIGS
jgi:hypothetical protein